MLPDDLKSHAGALSVEEHLPGAITGGKRERGEATLEIEPARIVEACWILKDSGNFIRLSSITAVDWHLREPRFEVVYHLHSIERNERLRLKCRLGGVEPEIDSVAAVWPSADWYEREAFDLFGIRFRNHPSLRRLLMPEDWEGHPLRKDYPVQGPRYLYDER